MLWVSSLKGKDLATQQSPQEKRVNGGGAGRGRELRAWGLVLRQRGGVEKQHRPSGPPRGPPSGSARHLDGHLVVVAELQEEVHWAVAKLVTDESLPTSTQYLPVESAEAQRGPR